MPPLKETLSKLSTYLLLNHQSVDNLSINDGKLGISLALLLSSRVFDDKCLRQCAEELWDSLIKEAIPMLSSAELRIDIIRSILILKKLDILKGDITDYAINWGIDCLKVCKSSTDFVNNRFGDIISLLIILSEYIPRSIVADFFSILLDTLLRLLETKHMNLSTGAEEYEKFLMLARILHMGKECEDLIHSIILLHNSGKICIETSMLYIIKELYDTKKLQLPLDNLLNSDYIEHSIKYCINLRDFSNLLYQEYCASRELSGFTMDCISTKFIVELLPTNTQERFCYKGGLSRYIALLSLCMLHRETKMDIHPYSLYI
jgi:hypothetical protein